MVPNKRLPGFSGEWVQQKLSSTGKVVSGGTPDTTNEEYWDGDILWLTPTDVTALKNKHVKNTYRKITVLGLKNSSARMIPANSVMVCTRASVGDVSISTTEICTNQGFKSIIPNTNFDSVFLYFILSNNKKKLVQLSSGSTFLELSKSDFDNITFSFPPLDEQRAIADLLTTWDEAIEANEQLLANSQQRKQALMQQLLTGKKRLPGFSGEWEETSLSRIGTTYSGLTGKTKENFGKGASYIPYKNIFTNPKLDISFFDLVDVKENERQNLVKKGDIFFTTSSETPDEVGMSSVLTEEVGTLYLNSFCFGFRPNAHDVIYDKFAVHYFRSKPARKKISTLAQGATRYNISANKLLMLRFNLPPLDEQRAIADVLSSADDEIEAIQQRIDNLKAQKKGLMQQLLTATKRINPQEVVSA